MKLVWVASVVGALGTSGCASSEPVPREQTSAGPTDDDDDVATSGVPEPTSTTEGPTTDPTTAATDETDGPSTTPTAGPGEGSTGSDESTGAPPTDCAGATSNITQNGEVLASSVFDSLFGPAYEADLAIDGDVATSWFSAGPSEDGVESTFEWYTQFDHCIDGIALISNSMHANPDFHEGFGFEAATVEIVDQSGSVVFEEDLDLSGTPDPDIVLDAGGVLGNQIRLRFREHESEDCGGFAELAIDGRTQR
ncbi:MAG: hypothetical protein ACRBN8_10325 [Nannocystales bacterium]